MSKRLKIKKNAIRIARERKRKNVTFCARGKKMFIFCRRACTGVFVYIYTLQSRETWKNYVKRQKNLHVELLLRKKVFYTHIMQKKVVPHRFFFSLFMHKNLVFCSRVLRSDIFPPRFFEKKVIACDKHHPLISRTPSFLRGLPISSMYVSR